MLPFAAVFRVGEGQRTTARLLPMNHRAKLISALVALTGAWPLAAQQAPAPSAATAKPGAIATGKVGDVEADAEVVKLTPFEVGASRDTGYQATETLAGTRIRTDLRTSGAVFQSTRRNS